MSSNNLPQYVEQENATHVPRRRASISVAWDADDDDDKLPDKDNEKPSTHGGDVITGESKSNLGLERLSSYAHQHLAQEEAVNNALSNNHHRGGDASPASSSDIVLGSVTSDILTEKVMQNNPQLSLVHDQLEEQMVKLLQDVQRKEGISLASEERKAEQEEAYNTLSQVPPFSYLPIPEQRRLVHDLHQIEYTDGEIIVNQGSEDDDVYILAQGRVVMVQIRSSFKFIVKSTAKFVGYLDAPAYFGEWGTLFDSKRNAQVVAGAPTTRVYRMTGQRFEELCQQQQAFRLKLALGLRQNGIFSHIDSFVAIVRRAVAHDTVFDFPAILESYRKMVPAIHCNLHSSELDLEGWTYAVRRLPDSITSVYVYLLANHIPMPFMHPAFDLRAVQVRTVARRRQSFALDRHGASGKLLVVMREKYSDVLDFLSLLCAHIHESAKLRAKLSRPSALHCIHTCLWKAPTSPQQQQSAAPTAVGQRQYQVASLEEQKAAMDKLPLTQEEKMGLQTLWPKDFLYRIWDIITLHENIQVRSDLSSAYVDSTDRWAESIRRAALELLNASCDMCAKYVFSVFFFFFL